MPSDCIAIIIFIILADSFAATKSDNVADFVAGCGIKQGCLLVPPGCEQPTGPNCTTMFSWARSADNQGFTFKMRGYLDDLRLMTGSDITYYTAIGFSFDEYMGNDTVLVCIVDNTGYGGVFIAWNDQHDNHIQLQATEVLLRRTTVSQVDGQLYCEGTWNFSGYSKIVAPNYLHDLASNISFHLLIARGYSDPRSHQLKGHAMMDGPKFPWISWDRMRFCPPSVADCTPYTMWLNESHQAMPSRGAKLYAATIHGCLMTLCCFLFIPFGIFSARFAKGYRGNVCGTAIWFQVHRACMLLTIVLMTIAFFVVYWQQNFLMFSCSTLCYTDDFDRWIHAVLGTVVFALCCGQVLIGILRPSLSSKIRPIFNLGHAFNGFFIWIGSSANSILSISIGKTGFPYLFGKMPQGIMACALIAFGLCFGLLEWFSRRESYVPANANPDQVQQLRNQQNPQNTGGVNKEKSPGFMPVLLLTFNGLIGMAIVIAIISMLVKSFIQISSMT